MDHQSLFRMKVPTRYDNQSNCVLNSLQTVYGSQRLSDITLVVGGISYPSHRFILCVMSDVFEAMLDSNWSESRQQVIHLQEDPQCVEVFPTFLKYFYTGTIWLGQTNVVAILVLADKYNILNLTAQCFQFMLANIRGAAEHGDLVLWLQYALSVNRPSSADDLYYYEMWKNNGSADIKPPWNNLIKSCCTYIKWHLKECRNCFNTFDCDVLVGLLKQSDIVVCDEMDIFGYVIGWLDHQSRERLVECNDADTNKAHMSSLIEIVMSHVRFPMLLPRQMAKIFTFSIVKQNREFFFEKMAAAMECQADEMRTLSTMGHLLECTPRLYTSKRWGESFDYRYPCHPLLQKDIASCCSLFDKDEEQKKSHWEIKLTVEKPLQPLNQIPLVIHSRIRKLPQGAEIVSRHVRVTILVYRICYDVVSIVQNVVLSNESHIDIPILESMLKDFEERELDFHFIITPISLGFTDCHVDPIIQYRL